MAGYATNRLIAAGTTNATLVKTSPAEVHGWYLYNAAAYAVFLKLYDSATIPTAGSGTPKITIGVPAGAGANLLGADEGATFTAGLGYTITKLAADNDTTVVVAGDLIVNLFYR
jgi:hypothetical protein